jgi:hypothetical protein
VDRHPAHQRTCLAACGTDALTAIAGAGHLASTVAQNPMLIPQARQASAKIFFDRNDFSDADSFVRDFRANLQAPL